MPNTFTLIASSTVGAGGSASIDFTSIPNTYTDLCLKLSLRNSYAGTYVSGKLRVNSNSSSIYTSRILSGGGSSVGSSSYGPASQLEWGPAGANNLTANTFSSVEMYFPSYTSSNDKSISIDGVMETNDSSNNALQLWAGLAATSSAISSIEVNFNAGSWMQYSTAYLYGIVKS
jgi:hypothetical protein